MESNEKCEEKIMSEIKTRHSLFRTLQKSVQITHVICSGKPDNQVLVARSHRAKICRRGALAINAKRL